MPLGRWVIVVIGDWERYSDDVLSSVVRRLRSGGGGGDGAGAGAAAAEVFCVDRFASDL